MFYRWLVVNQEFETVESRHHVLARARAAARRHGPHAADVQDATVMTCRTCGAHACPAVGDRLPARFRVCPVCDAPDCAEDRKAERWEADINAMHQSARVLPADDRPCSLCGRPAGLGKCAEPSWVLCASCEGTDAARAAGFTHEAASGAR